MINHFFEEYLKDKGDQKKTRLYGIGSLIYLIIVRITYL